MLTLRLGEVLMGPGLGAVRKACLALSHTLLSALPPKRGPGYLHRRFFVFERT
jgi:hypothetical protein